MEQFFAQTVPQAVENVSLLSFVIVYLGGVVTSISPCMLSMIPLMVGYIGGYGETSRLKGFVMSFSFVLGLSVTFAILGIAAALLGRIFGQIGDAWLYIIAGVAILMGLQLLGVINISFPTLSKMPVKGGGITGAFVFGLLFGLVASPCATPVLAVIIAFVAAKGQIWYGGALLFSYGLGHGLPLLIVGTFTAVLKSFAGFQRWAKYTTYASGILLIIFGLYFLTLARWY